MPELERGLSNLAESLGARAALKRHSGGAESALEKERERDRRLRDRERLYTVTWRIFLLLFSGGASPKLSLTVPATADDVVRLNIKPYSVYAVTLQKCSRAVAIIRRIHRIHPPSTLLLLILLWLTYVRLGMFIRFGCRLMEVGTAKHQNITSIIIAAYSRTSLSYIYTILIWDKHIFTYTGILLLYCRPKET